MQRFVDSDTFVVAVLVMVVGGYKLATNPQAQSSVSALLVRTGVLSEDPETPERVLISTDRPEEPEPARLVVEPPVNRTVVAAAANVVHPPLTRPELPPRPARQWPIAISHPEYPIAGPDECSMQCDCPECMGLPIEGD